MEKKSLKTYKTWAIVLAVVTMVLGLVMVFWPGISAVAICYLMGAVCIAAGIYEIIPGFAVSLIIAVIVSKCSKAPSKEVTALFDKVASDVEI